ncbi:MAG: signal recognition particle-docking protein FtsY [Candidatus Bruticola sp.]
MFRNWFKRSSTDEKQAQNNPTETPAAPETAETQPVEQNEAEAAEAEAAVHQSKEEKQSDKKGLRGFLDSARELALTPVDPWFNKMAKGLDKTRQNLVSRVSSLFNSSKRIDEDFWDELENILLTADVGLTASTSILEKLQNVQKSKKISDPAALLDELKQILGEILNRRKNEQCDFNLPSDRLKIIMMVGVNGVGKTTTAAKLAAKFKNDGHKVILAAADTFRAAAIDQLKSWAQRINIDIVSHQEGSDPSAVVFDSIKAAQARNCDLVIIDTAGRLHNKINLMEELGKIRRVCDKACPDALHETWLVLDATTGQNALEQAKVFNKAVTLTGVVMCKLDGTGKGGVVIAVGEEFNLPVRYIGVGEAADDLREFNPDLFLEALFNDPASYKDIENRDDKTVEEDQ